MTPEFAIRIFAAATTAEEAELLYQIIRSPPEDFAMDRFALSAAYERRKTELEGSSRDTQTRSYPRFPKSQEAVCGGPLGHDGDERLPSDPAPSDRPAKAREHRANRQRHR